MIKAKNTTEILLNLRKLMVSKNLKAYLVPMNDEHNNEYISKADEKISYITGFRGSFGMAAITLNDASLWTDGRYIEQAQKSVDQNWKVFEYPKEPSCYSWLNTNLTDSSQIGIYEFTTTNTFYNELTKKLDKKHKLIKLDTCLVDEIWTDRPSRPSNPIRILDKSVTGRTWKEKIDDIRAKLAKENVDCLFLSALDEIAWLFNLRGNDIDYNPLFYSFCVVTSDEIHLFIDQGHLVNPSKLCNYFLQSSCKKYQVNTHDYKHSNRKIKQIFENQQKIWFDFDANIGFMHMVEENKRHIADSPVKLSKCVKSKEEIDSMTTCAIQDSVALCRFYYWLESEVGKPNCSLTEAGVAKKVDFFRSQLPNFVSPSFATISCMGSNGGMIHYTAEKGSDAAITDRQLFLLDSGGQYSNGGTTDVTRTVHLGDPSKEEKVAFTLVLKGYMELARAVFLLNYPAYKLDYLARMHLWRRHTNYSHGTGHGVGSFLCVHEGPCSFSSKSINVSETSGLLPGMIITIEPGLYKPGCYGIRVESDFCVEVHVDTDTELDLGAKSTRQETFLHFSPLTYFPIQTKLIEMSLMTQEEITYLNDYHQKCRDKLGEVLLSGGYTKEHQWLIQQTEPISLVQ